MSIKLQADRQKSRKGIGGAPIGNHNAKKHGMRNTRFWRIWRDMKNRCLNPNNHGYKNYGGRGIKVGGEWQSFEGFYGDMYIPYTKHAQEHGEKNTTLERIDFNGNYEVDNCRWATKQEQNRNYSRNRFITFQGKKLPIIAWAELFKIDANSLYSRVHRGQRLEEYFHKLTSHGD